MVHTGNNGFKLQLGGAGFLGADFPDESQSVFGTAAAVHPGLLSFRRQVQNFCGYVTYNNNSTCSFPLTCFAVMFAVFLCSLTFGAVTLVTGILGGCSGTFLSRMFRNRLPYVDPLICAVGLLGSVPCFLICVFVASASIPTTYVRHELPLSHFHCCSVHSPETGLAVAGVHSDSLPVGSCFVNSEIGFIVFKLAEALCILSRLSFSCCLSLSHDK